MALEKITPDQRIVPAPDLRTEEYRDSVLLKTTIARNQEKFLSDHERIIELEQLVAFLMTQIL